MNSMTMNDVMLAAFFDELEGIDKEAGWLRNTALGLGLAGALAGGGRAMTSKAVAAGAGKLARPAITQTVKAPARGVFAMGGRSAQARQLQGMGVLPR